MGDSSFSHSLNPYPPKGSCTIFSLYIERLIHYYEKYSTDLYQLLHPTYSPGYLDNAKTVLDVVPHGLATHTLIN